MTRTSARSRYAYLYVGDDGSSERQGREAYVFLFTAASVVSRTMFVVVVVVAVAAVVKVFVLLVSSTRR